MAQADEAAVTRIRHIADLADADIEEHLENLVGPYRGSGLSIGCHRYRGGSCGNIVRAEV
jgi:hypothetical protein